MYHLVIFLWSAPVTFRRVALETPEWTSRDSNHHRQSVSAGKTNAIPTEPSGRLHCIISSWYGSRNKGKNNHTTRPYQRVSEATKAPCGKVENEAARFALIKGIEPQPYHASWCEPFTPLRCHTPPSAGWKELQASPSLWTVLQSWRCWMCSVV